MEIIAIIFAAVAALVLGLTLALDISATREYEKAERVTGTVMWRDRDSMISAYGSGPAGRHKRKYCQYRVEYYANGKRCRGTIQTKEKGLEHGDQVEVRYVLDKKTGEAIVVTPVFRDRLREFAIGAVLGTIWAGVLICLKMNGMLD